MAQRYRLHLSDGTILLVDHDSLNTWLVDRKAMVQTEGSKMWLPLREFLAAEREAAFRASPRRTAKTREELPLIPPPPRKGDKGPPPSEPPGAEPVKPAPVAPEPVPIAPTPPRVEPAPFMPATPPPPAPQPLTPPPPPVPAPRAVTPPPPRAEPMSWVPATPPPPAPRVTPLPVTPLPVTPPPATPPPATPPVLPTPRERVPERVERRQPTFSEPAEERPIGQPAGVEPVAAAVAPARKPVPRPPAPRPDDSISPIPLVPLEDEETPLTPVIPLAKERGPAARPSPHPLAADVFADEERSRVAADTYGEELPVIPFKPLPDEERARAWAARDAAPAGGQDEEFEDRFDEPAAGSGLRHADVVFLRIMATLGGVLSRLLDSLVRYERMQRSRRAAARSVSASSRRADAPARALPPKLAGALQSLGELLASGIAKVGALRPPKAAHESRSLGELLASAIPRPSARPQPTQESRMAEAPPAAAEAPWVSDEVLAAAQRRPAETPKPDEGIWPRPAVSPGLALPEPSRPAARPTPAPKPPLPISELPVLRLAEVPTTEEEEGDLYEGDYQYPGHRSSGLARGLWRWTTRLAVLAVLAGGGIWAASTWRSWFPRAGEVGERALTTSDRQVRSIETEKERQQALQAGIAQLPQLAPETIQLVLSSKPGDVLDVPELFQTANDATDRGAASLTREEGLELAALRDGMLAGLPATEREQVRDYERARAFGLALPSEERSALAILARGARALPPERLARLQALLGKAIAAGLKPGATP